MSRAKISSPAASSAAALGLAGQPLRDSSGPVVPGGPAPTSLPSIHRFSVNCAYCQIPKVKVKGLRSRLDCNSCGAGTDIEEDGTCYYCGEDPIVVHWVGEAPPPAKLVREKTP